MSRSLAAGLEMLKQLQDMEVALQVAEMRALAAERDGAKRIEELEGELRQARADADQRELEFERVAVALAETQEFYDWLMLQDVSSAVMYVSRLDDKRRRVLVEGRSDIDLAVGFADRPRAG